MDVRKKVDQGNVPPRWEGLAAGQELRSCQKAGWPTKTAREAWGQWESREHRQCAPEQGQHRMRRCPSDMARMYGGGKCLSIQYFKGSTVRRR